MPALLIPSTRQPKTVRDTIISILATEWPLTAKKIYNRVRQNGHQVSYQAVHKVLKELMAEEVLERKEDREYKINSYWLKHIKEFVDKTQNQYLDNSKPSVEKLLTENSTTATFENLFEFYDFMVDFLTRFAGNKNDAYVHFNHLWWSLSFEGERYIRFKNMVNSFGSATFLCRYDTPADRIIFDHYNSFKPPCKIVYDVDCAKDCDIFVSGDYIAQIFFTEKFKKKINYAYNIMRETKSDSLNKLLETLFFEKTSIILLVNRNPTLSEQIRQETAKHFDKNFTSSKHSASYSKEDQGTESIQTFVFNSIYEVDKFLLKHALKFDTSGRKIILCFYWSHLWIPLFISRDVYRDIKMLKRKFDTYGISKNNTSLDKWCLAFWKNNSDFAVKCGINLKSEDFVVVDNMVIQVFYPEELKMELFSTFSKTTDVSQIDSEKLFQNIFEKQYTIPVIVTKNEKMANSLKNKVLKHFKEAKWQSA